MKTFCVILLSMIIVKSNAQNNTKDMENDKTTILSDPSLKDKLSPMQYNVCVGKGTERAFTGIYWNHHEKGTYSCVVCKTPLFSSDSKYDSGSGWPSFYQALDKEKVAELRDDTFGMIRVEIVCKKCGSHLGHVFNDGPKPTGMRYCVNSASLDFKK